MPSPQKNLSYYDWENDEYSHFMLKLMRKLEPRFIAKNQIIFKEDVHLDEFLFILKGQVQIGFYTKNKRRASKII